MRDNRLYHCVSHLDIVQNKHRYILMHHLLTDICYALNTFDTSVIKKFNVIFRCKNEMFGALFSSCFVRK